MIKKYNFAKIVLGVLTGVIITTGGSFITSRASDFSDEPIIFDTEYTGVVDNTNAEDLYTLSLPSDGNVTFSGFGINGYVDIVITDNLGQKCIDRTIWSGPEKTEFPCSLKKGKYDVVVYGHGYNVPYYFTCNYDFDSSTNTKVQSVKKGTLKVTAPKGSNVNGFEIRYKTSKESDWTICKVETKKNLNKTLTRLKSNEKYFIQTRKYVTDSYGYTYYSNWTKKQSVKIK